MGAGWCGWRQRRIDRRWSVALSTIQMSADAGGSIVMPVGLPPPEVMVQLPRSEPPTVYLKTLSVGAVVDDPDARAVGDEVGGVGVAAVQAEAAGGGLAAGEAAGGAGVAIDLVALGIDDPDVGAVGGDAFELS